MNTDGLDALHQDLRTLRQALDDEDLERAAEVLHEHDQRLRRYMGQLGQDAPLGALRELLELQQRLQSHMRRVRDEHAARLAGLRRSGQASQHYREAAR
ncbi:hypothetical protein [Xanthomonas sp. XNM01]|uniref:hypothetical protein n=1 Tax=Xanthomonas sp. XNM01 TaxID=2769289 RepID=UPI0017810447|nr:hypothetical protein [Xanthomonas sp. XNM01]MBD9368309.1 hypothetical protein [Xanthomonas sp. XNM01]